MEVMAEVEEVMMTMVKETVMMTIVEARGVVGVLVTATTGEVGVEVMGEVEEVMMAMVAMVEVEEEGEASLHGSSYRETTCSETLSL